MRCCLFLYFVFKGSTEDNNTLSCSFIITLSDPHLSFSCSLVEEFYGNRYQSGSFPLINPGSVYHCLLGFFIKCMPPSRAHPNDRLSSYTHHKYLDLA